MYQPSSENPPYDQPQYGYGQQPPYGQQYGQASQYDQPEYYQPQPLMDQQQMYTKPQYQDDIPQYGTPPPIRSNEVGIETGEGEKAKTSKKWNDVWATILWLLNLGAFIGVAVVAVDTYQSHQYSNKAVMSESAYPGITFDVNTFQLLAYSGICGFGISLLYLLLANFCPGPLIVSTFIGSIIVYFGVTIFYFVNHYYSAAIIFLIFSCLYAMCFVWWKAKIPFATVMLKTITDITKKYPSTIFIGIVSLVSQTAFCYLFMFTVVGAYQRWFNSYGSNTELNCVMVFLVFSFYWTSQVIAYITHVTVAGIFATVYFVNDGIRHPAWGSLKRAMTTSFGSICLGSLLIAFINLIRYFLEIARMNADNACGAFCICMLQCFVNCAAGLFEWFNYYAFSGIAIYGKAFVPAAQQTWNMVKDRGVDAMINDSLIGNVLFMGGLTTGVLCGLFGYLYLLITKPTYNQFGGMTPIIVMMCFLTGASMFSSIATVISSGSATTFVCLAEDPDALRRTKPELFEQVRQTYPQVVQGV